MISIPRNEATVRENDLECREVSSRKRLDCEVPETASYSEHYQVIRVDNLCSRSYCEAGEMITIELNLANSVSIV